MLDHADLTKEDEELIEGVIHDIESRFRINTSNSLTVPFRKFELLKDYTNIISYKNISIEQSTEITFVSFVKIEYPYLLRRYGTGIAYELQAYVFVKFPRSFGHLIIKRETIQNKVIELFQPLEIDFKEDKAFSRKFYVLAKDKEKAYELINENFRGELKKLKDRDVYLEGLNDVMLICNKKGVADDSLYDLIGLGYRISEIFQRSYGP